MKGLAYSTADLPVLVSALAARCHHRVLSLLFGHAGGPTFYEDSWADSEPPKYCQAQPVLFSPAYHIVTRGANPMDLSVSSRILLTADAIKVTATASTLVGGRLWCAFRCQMTINHRTVYLSLSALVCEERVLFVISNAHS